MARGSSKPSPVKMQAYLSGIEYPATKEDVCDAARDNDAPDDIMDILEQIPQDDYCSPQDVQRAYELTKDKLSPTR
ncbi:MAG: DUF2795 domain-containing protein [Pirellulales bacterium]